MIFVPLKKVGAASFIPLGTSRPASSDLTSGADQTTNLRCDATCLKTPLTAHTKVVAFGDASCRHGDVLCAKAHVMGPTNAPRQFLVPKESPITSALRPTASTPAPVVPTLS